MFLILKQTFPKTRATSGIMTYNHIIIDAIDQVPPSTFSFLEELLVRKSLNFGWTPRNSQTLNIIVGSKKVVEN